MLRRTLNVEITGIGANKDVVLKMLDKAGANFTRIATVLNGEEEYFSIASNISDKKFWKIYRRLSRYGDLTIN